MYRKGYVQASLLCVPTTLSVEAFSAKEDNRGVKVQLHEFLLKRYQAMNKCEWHGLTCFQ